MKIHVAFPITDKPFGGGNQFLRALREYFYMQDCYADDPFEADVLIFNSYPFGVAESLYYLVHRLKRKNPDLTVIHRVDGPISVVRGSARDVAADNSIALFNELLADATVFQSAWSRDLCLEYGVNAGHPSTVISNAPDPNLFFPSQPESSLRQGIRCRIIATSWSANWRKGFDIYQYLDRALDFTRYEMTFVGNCPMEFRNIRRRSPLPSRELGDLLRQHDMYITASVDDPCSNSLIEALHTKLPSVARRSGGHPELIGDGGILFDRHSDVLAAIDYCASQLSSCRSRIVMPTITEIGESYLNFAKEVHAFKAIRPHQLSKRRLLRLQASVLSQRYKSRATQVIAKRLPIREDRFYEGIGHFRRMPRTVDSIDPWNEGTAKRWVSEVIFRLPLFMDCMRHPSNTSLYRYSYSSDLQPQPSLAASVFAAKIRYMLGLNDDDNRRALVEHIQSFRRRDGSICDPWVEKNSRWRRISVARKTRSITNLFNQETARAETRQAFAALRCLDSKPLAPFAGIPTSINEMVAYIEQLDWTQPWAAASHISHLAFFLHHHMLWFGKICQSTPDALFSEVESRYRRSDGAWHSEDAIISIIDKVNGAMKMITAMDASEQPGPANPEGLIDLCLSALSEGHACNHFNVICVLHRCHAQTDYRADEIRSYCLERLRQYQTHYWPYQGGFSFFPSGANDYYYGARISTGMAEPDLHGTVLMLWGIVLLVDLLGWNDEFGLKRPWT